MGADPSRTGRSAWGIPPGPYCSSGAKTTGPARRADENKFVLEQLFQEDVHGRLPSSTPTGRPLTLKTNISPRKNASVLKLPSQMFGLPFPGSAGRSPGGRGGRRCRSCLVECVLRAGRVGNGPVGSIMAVGMPVGKQNVEEEPHRQRNLLWKISGIS